MASGGGNYLQDDIFQLLESSGTEKVTRAVILETLQSTKEIWMIHLLVDYYLKTQSTVALEIMAELNESHSRALIEKLSDGLKNQETKLQALQLLLYLVYREVPWSRQLVEMHVFTVVLKLLKSELDVPVLMSALMVVIILLPSSPVAMAQHLRTIFQVFYRLCDFCVKKPANTPDVFILHLQVSLYSLFHRLYGMYPCTFTNFITSECTNKESLLIYQQVILPMVERVRLHPKLIIGQKEDETSMNRWKNQETQDIIVNCSQLSLDLIENATEESRCPIFSALPYFHEKPVFKKDGTIASPEALTTSTTKSSTTTPSLSGSAFHTLSVLNHLGDVGESPSVLLGLSTPPSSHRATPSTSFTEHSIVTTAMTDVSTDITPRKTVESCAEDTDEARIKGGAIGLAEASKQEVCRSGSQSANTVPPTTPVTPGGVIFTYPSPSTPATPDQAARMKTDVKADPITKSPAVRNLSFQSPVKVREKSESLDVGQTESTESQSIEKSLESDSTSKFEKEEKSNDSQACILLVGLNRDKKVEDDKGESSNVSQTDTADDGSAVTVVNLPQVVEHLVTEDSDDLDQEVEDINSEKMDRVEENWPSPSASSVSTLASQGDMTADSVKQFLKKVNRIRFDSITSSSSSEVDNGARRLLDTRPRSCPPCGDRKSFYIKQTPIQPRVKHQGNKKTKPNVTTSDSSKKTKEKNSKKVDKESKEANVELIEVLPPAVKPVFQYILAPAKLSVCNKCQHEIVLTSDTQTGSKVTSEPLTVKGSEVCLFSSLCPSELLDRHLRLGSDIHAKELTRIPLTSKDSVNWTHFGGLPPADEVNILKGQILLMQNQLLYERHKRSNHAKRNRRLLRRIANKAFLEEQQKSLVKQVSEKNQEIQQLEISVKLLQENCRGMQQSQESEDYTKLVHFKTALKENKDMKAASVALKNLLLNQTEDYDKLKKKLDCVEHRNLEHEKELEICRERLANTDALKKQVLQLQKEVLLMQELNLKCQEKLQLATHSDRREFEQSSLVTSLQAKVKELTKEKKKKDKLLEAYKTKIDEVEREIKVKTKALNEAKKHLENYKLGHEGELNAVEERHSGMIRICQVLEAKIMEISCQLDQKLHKEMVKTRKSLPGPADISHSNKEKEREAALESTGKVKDEFWPLATEIAQQKVDLGIKDIPQVAETAGTGQYQGASVVMAREYFSRTSSNFTDVSSELVSSDHGADTESSVPISGQSLETEPFPDSGVASRASERGDSDVSMRSASGFSTNTGDSGCWQTKS